MIKSFFCSALFVFGFMVYAAAADPGRQANEAYERGAFEEAEALYKEAIEANPNDARLRFNLGNALARQGKAEEAERAYETFRAMAQTPEERAMADYSLGNLKAAQQEWEQALDQYREALRQAPDDPDAVHNYEYALRRMQQEQEQQNDQQQQEQDQGEEQQDQQDQQGQPQDGSGQGQQSESDQQQSGQPGNQPEQSGQEQQPANAQPEPGEEGQQELKGMPEGQMSEEEAEQLLNAISNREQELLKDFLKNLNKESARNEKDW